MKNLYFFTAFLWCSIICAQEYLAELPSNPAPNKCYAKCIVPDEYKDEIVQIRVKPAYNKLKIIPAEYKTENQEFVIRPASKRFIYVPATYATVVDTLWIKDPYHQLKVTPATFTKSTEQVEIKAKSGQWVAGEKDPDCPSIDPADCRVFHYVENQAVVRDIEVKTVKNAPFKNKNLVKGKYELITRQKEIQPAHTITEEIPAKTIRVVRRVLVKDETTEEIEIPAEYKNIVKKVLVKKGGDEYLARSPLYDT